LYLAIALDVAEYEHAITPRFQHTMDLLQAHSHLGQINLLIGSQSSIEFLPVFTAQKPQPIVTGIIKCTEIGRT